MIQGERLRFVMSMRAVGEGHISSVAFREGIIGPGADFQLWPQSGPAMAAVADDRHQSEPDAPVLVHRQLGSAISNSVLFPITEAQRNGLEDLRLVRFVHEDGESEYIGTYTAYSGQAIRSELMRTRDFSSFCLEPLVGHAARHKGMALFPRKIDGRYRMIARQDGKNITILTSDRLNHWEDEGQLLIRPQFPWEFIQMGNCGSPIECDAGWLLLTHGVGAMRKYSLGAALLDRDDPTRVLARTSCPILSAADSDREGYVPNVVYTCGAVRVGERLFIPYGISDSAIGFATTTVDKLLASDGLTAWPARLDPVTSVDRLEAPPATVIGRAGGEADHEIGECPQPDMIARAGRRGHDLQLALGVDRDVHEEVERDGDCVGFDPERRQRFGEVAKAAAMDGLVGVKMPERRLAARGQQKVMQADAILDDLDHRV